MLRSGLHLVIAVAALVAAAFPAAADELGWQTYTNARYGYSVDVPAGFLLAQPAADNGDGLSFASTDGRAYLAVWGANNVSGTTIEAYYQAALARPDVGIVTYQRKTSGWYVLSGYRTADGNPGLHELIFYERVAIAPDGSAISGVLIFNAPSLKEKMGPIITRISKSLTPPR